MGVRDRRRFIGGNQRVPHRITRFQSRVNIARTIFLVDPTHRAIVVARAGLALDVLTPVARRPVWVPVVVSTISLVLNSMTPSAAERRLWAPVVTAMLIAGLIAAPST